MQATKALSLLKTLLKSKNSITRFNDEANISHQTHYATKNFQ
jgi:hypothetical protein